jgi:hypothetical protein
MRKAELLYQVLDDAHVHEALATLPEQGGYIYSPTNRLLYAGTNSGDFQPSDAFLTNARKQGQVAFDFASPGHTYQKEGVALTFRRPGEPKLYLVIVTAYDNAGFVREYALLEMLLYGYLGAIVLVACLGLLFARWALLPFNRLIGQLRRPNSTQAFRLQPLKTKLVS